MLKLRPTWFALGCLLIVLTGAYGVFAAHDIAIIARAWAQDTGAPSTVVDVQPILLQVISVFGSILMLLLMWTARKLNGFIAAKTGLTGLHIDDLVRTYGNMALDNGVNFAVSKIKAEDWGKFEVKNQVAAQAANYAIQFAPGALKHFGIDLNDRAAIEQKAMAALTKLWPDLGDPDPAAAIVKVAG